MPIASKPECVDGPRQQLTTRRRLRECLFQANPSVLMAPPTTHNKTEIEEMPIASKPEALMAHANNSQQEGD